MTTIITKNGTGVPSDSSLSTGELAVDTTNGKLYTSSNGTNVVNVGSSTGIDDNATATAMTLDTSGNVGIGTSSPSELLTVAGAGSTARISINDTDTAAATMTGLLEFDGSDIRAGYFGYVSGNMQLYTSVNDITMSTGGAERLRIDASGNVGIGTSSPQSKTTVAGAANNAALPIGSASASDAQLRIANNNSASYGLGSELLFEVATAGSSPVAGIRGTYQNFNGAGDFAGTLVFGTQKTLAGGILPRMTIDEDGFVGIGTDSPSAVGTKTTVEVQGVDGGAIRIGTPASNMFIDHDGVAGTRIRANAADMFIGATSGEVSFGTGSGGAERMRIDSSGNLLVGTTSSANNSAVGIKLRPEGSGSGNEPRLSIVGASSNIGEVGYSLYSTTASAYRFYTTYSGNIYATSTSITGISDQSLKENIRDLDKGLDTVLALKPRRFDWINGDGEDIMGFIAQEVDEVMPELVHDYEYSEGVTKKGLKMGDMIPSMVKAIQEQQAMIEELKAEVAALKGA